MNKQDYSNYSKEELIELLINKDKTIKYLKYELEDISRGKYNGPTYVRIANSALLHVKSIENNT